MRTPAAHPDPSATMCTSPPVFCCWKLAFCSPSFPPELPVNGTLACRAFCGCLFFSHIAKWVCDLMQWVNGHPLLSMTKCEDGPQSPPAHPLGSICSPPIRGGLGMKLLWMNTLEQVFCEHESLLLLNENPAALFLVIPFTVLGWQWWKLPWTDFSLQHSCKIVKWDSQASVINKIMYL